VRINNSRGVSARGLGTERYGNKNPERAKVPKRQRRFETMPRSKYEIYIHLVWATKKREPYITFEFESILRNIFREKCRKFGLEILAFGNTANHIHLLLSINPNVKIAEFAAEAKGTTSYYINHESGRSLYWQDGYGCFSIGRSELTQVKAYVMNQKIHHFENTIINGLEEC
jgi:putative transposase